MKKGLTVFFLVVVLAAPAMAAPRDDDARGVRGAVSRVLLLLEKLVRGVAPLDDIGPMPPKP